MPDSKLASDEIREQILDAANSRFSHFGYGKTTMAEIATDCDMSPANLYRHFENKLDIGAGLACRCLGSKEALLKNITENRDQSAAEGLRQFVLETLRYTYAQIDEQPRLNEMVNAISQQRADLVTTHNANKIALLTQLLERGQQSDEFSPCDCHHTAQTILTTIILFDVPMFMHMYSLDEFETMANRVVDLLLNGLLTPSPSHDKETS